jgi:23S rRNA pseudouridine2605 synthase
MDNNAQRLQKILASAGYGSRRACEDILRQGRVRVNGQQAKLGDSADPARDNITVDGQHVHVTTSHTYIALYKPTNVISTLSDELERKTVRDLVPVEGRLVPVGRLDADSEGLVLLTDDGQLTNLLTHPRYEHEKEYHVYVTGHPDETTLDQWRRGVELPDLDDKTHDGGRTLPAQVEEIRTRARSDGTWLRVVMREGRKRQIRRIAGMLGHPVRQLLRVRIGPLKLGNMKPGEWRRLTARELQDLSQISNPESRTLKAKPARNPRHTARGNRNPREIKKPKSPRERR